MHCFPMYSGWMGIGISRKNLHRLTFPRVRWSTRWAVGNHPLLSMDEKVLWGLRVFGLDINDGELSKAPTGAYDATIRADITRYRGREDADVVICQALLEHVTDTNSAFAGLASILKKTASPSSSRRQKTLSTLV